MLIPDKPLEKEEYRGLLLRFTFGEEYGIYRIFLDGKNVLSEGNYLGLDSIRLREHWIKKRKFLG